MANKTYRSFTHFSVTYEKNSEFLAGLDQVSVCLFIVLKHFIPITCIFNVERGLLLHALDKSQIISLRAQVT